MANTTISTGLKVAQWSQKFFKEYVRESRYFRYMSESGDNVIYVNKELGKKAGDNITFGLVMELEESGTEGDDQLEGNEENLDNYSDTVTVNQLRHAVSRGEMEQKRTLLDVLEHAQERLKKWAMRQLRDLLTARLLCFNLDGVTTYAASSETQKDAALAANTDRVLFGTLLSNRSTTDHSASLLNVDTTDDTLDTGISGLLARIAETADPKITPLTISEDEEWWVAFIGTNPYRDLKAALDTVHQNAGPRDMKENPIFRAGDLVHNATIFRKIPEMASIGSVGAASAPVYNVAFCGQQAALLGWAQMTRVIRNGRDGRDFGNIRAVGVAEIRGAKKTVFNEKFHGIVQGYVAAAADA